MQLSKRLLAIAAMIRKDGVLADVAPSILQIMGLPQPAEMTGHSLINK